MGGAVGAAAWVVVVEGARVVVVVDGGRVVVGASVVVVDGGRVVVGAWVVVVVVVGACVVVVGALAVLWPAAAGPTSTTKQCTVPGPLGVRQSGGGGGVTGRAAAPAAAAHSDPSATRGRAERRPRPPPVPGARTDTGPSCPSPISRARPDRHALLLSAAADGVGVGRRRGPG